MNTHYDVIVIGAGFAGVAAARDLSLSGHSTALLEARDRIGGRTFMGEAFGKSLELGGGYVHWTQPHVWSELQRYGIGLNPPMDINKVLWIADRQLHSGSAADYEALVTPLITQCFSDARAHFPMPFEPAALDTREIEQQTLAQRVEALDLSTQDRDVLDGMLATFVHDHGKQGVAQFLLWSATYFGHWGAFLEAAGTWPIAGGTQRLLDAMMAESKADLHLSTPVAAIDDQGSRVVVTTRNGDSIEADQVVVAVPLNTLSDVAITPEVTPSVQELIADKHPMKTAKIWARVRGKVEPFMAFAPVDGYGINTARTEYYQDGDTILACFASDVSDIDVRSRSAVQQALHAFLPDMEVIDIACHDWANDEFAQGTWAHHRPGYLTQVLPKMRKPHGRIHFAGGDIATTGVGGIDGALETGLAAARRVSQQCRRPAPSRWSASRTAAGT